MCLINLSRTPPSFEYACLHLYPYLHKSRTFTKHIAHTQAQHIHTRTQSTTKVFHTLALQSWVKRFHELFYEAHWENWTQLWSVVANWRRSGIGGGGLVGLVGLVVLAVFDLHSGWAFDSSWLLACEVRTWVRLLGWDNLKIALFWISMSETQRKNQQKHCCITADTFSASLFPLSQVKHLKNSNDYKFVTLWFGCLVDTRLV